MTRRLSLAMWCLGLPGVVAMAWWGVPVMLEGKPLPAPLWVLSLASGAQSALLLALAAFAGAKVAGKVGLHAPALEAFAESRSTCGALRQQCFPGVVGGLLGAMLLWLLSRLAPDVAEPLRGVSLPPVVRLLYGGITEEVLVRWGLMGALTWALWRLVQRGSARPHDGIVWAAIMGSALLFGVGHLPAALALVGTPSVALVSYIVGGNAVFGAIAGYLFWRHGLESAMLAHLLAHAVLLNAQP